MDQAEGGAARRAHEISDLLCRIALDDVEVDRFKFLHAYRGEGRFQFVRKDVTILRLRCWVLLQ